MNIAFIPVRGGSKSIPLKNIKEIFGHPLVYWVAKSANDANCIDKVVIATDSEEIKQVVKNFKFEKLEIYDRNPNNATDTASTESVMLEYIEKAKLKKTDTFFLIQATSPMLKAEHIDAMYEFYCSVSCDSVFSAVREKQFHWIENLQNNVEPVNYDYQNRPRRQDFKGLLAENGACYINSVENITESKCRLSGNIRAFELPLYTAYEIDEAEDWIIVEELMKHFL